MEITKTFAPEKLPDKRGKDRLPTIIFERRTVKTPDDDMSILTINTYLKTNTMSQHRKYTAHHNKIYS